MVDSNNTNNDNSIMVIFEGQQYPVEREIAEDDEKLRALLTPFAPAAASAKIERVSEQQIKMTKQSGTKGNSPALHRKNPCKTSGMIPSETQENSPFLFLCETPEQINPAIVMARLVQHLELSGGLDLDSQGEIADEIEKAITQGTVTIDDYRATLDRLQQLSGYASIMLIGF